MTFAILPSTSSICAGVKSGELGIGLQKKFCCRAKIGSICQGGGKTTGRAGMSVRHAAPA
jgi:hypothetical protein